MTREQTAVARGPAAGPAAVTALRVLEQVGRRRPRVAVIGDFLLDGWWSGNVRRFAREAPAPVFEAQDRREQPGGAGNAAASLAGLGCRVDAVGLVGADAPGARLRGLLAGFGVDTSGLLATTAATRRKRRLVCGGQVLLRIDEGDADPPEAAPAHLAHRARAALAHADAVLVCDYGSRTMRRLSEQLGDLGQARSGPLVVDAHEPARWRGLAPEIVTPNAAEAAALLGMPDPGLQRGPQRAEVFTRRAPDLRQATGAATVVVTLDRDGSVALTADGRVLRSHAHPAPEQQASGAGDVFAAAMTAAAAAGYDIRDGIGFAQSACDVAVRQDGTSVCTAAQLAAWFDAGPLPVLGAPDLVRTLAARRAAGERVVFTNGCFDVLHSGHTHYLSQAKRLGDVLVVAINDDDSVRRLKGPDRPINGVADRARVLCALECVDYVTVFPQDSPAALLRAVRPDVYVKGGDYSPEMLAEADVVRAGGGEVVIVDYVADHSTTELVHRIQDAAAAPGPAAGARPGRAG